jgi:hypothetical protein
VLLNKNLDFIDNLNAVVYPDGTLPLGSAGTATLFLGDVRVATNVRLFGDTRAIGTRVSAVVQCGAQAGRDLAGQRLRGQRLVCVGLCAAGR